MPSGYETVLRALDADSVPRVHRFDGGRAFRPRVAVLPSAFNPPTLAHLRLLEIACEVEGMTGIAALLSTRNVEKGIYGASLADRVGMLAALNEARPDIAVLASNAARIPDQATALREANPDAAFDFVVGYDTLIRVFDPSYYDDMARDLGAFFEHHRLIAMNRGEATYGEVCRFLASDPVSVFAAQIVACQLEDEPARLSSTLARDDVARGDSPTGIPPAVRDYIDRQGLYRDDSSSPR